MNLYGAKSREFDYRNPPNWSNMVALSSVTCGSIQYLTDFSNSCVKFSDVCCLISEHCSHTHGHKHTMRNHKLKLMSFNRNEMSLM